MRRWLFRIFMVFLVLLVLCIATVQIVLSTNIPRNLVLGQLQQTLGLRIAADSFSTGWWGQTVLRDVSISLPLAGDSFLKVKSLTAKHTMLPAILFGRGVKVVSLDFDAPELLVRQDSTGRWNVAEVAELLRRTGGGQQAAAASAAKPDRVEIPRIDLHDGTIRIIDRDSRTAIVRPLRITGQPEGPLVWRYDMTAGPIDRPQLHLTGKLAPGGEWRHEIDLAVSDIEPWLRPWVADSQLRDQIRQTSIKGQWRGEWSNGALNALLQVTDSHIGMSTAKGPLNLNFSAGVVKLSTFAALSRPSSARPAASMW